MNYEKFKQLKKEILNSVDIAEKKLKEISNTKPGELIKDEVLKSSEYKIALNNFNKSFKTLREFNKYAPKKFSKQFAKEQRKY